MVVRLALLGAGRIGNTHAGAIHGNKGAKLVAVFDPLKRAAQAISEQYDCEIRDIEEMAKADDIDAVLICTPTNTHADLIEKFARAGKAVFCEKPIDLDLERARACISLVREMGTPLMLGFNRRFDPHFSALRARIDAGAIGEVEQVIITSRDPAPPPLEYIAHSGGIFRDMSIHDFDMARFLLGEEVESVYASASVLIDPDIARAGDFDSAMIILRTKSGKQAHINNSRRASYGYDQRIEVHGALGMIAANNPATLATQEANKEGFHAPVLHDFFMTRYLDAYANEINAFVKAIECKTKPSPDGKDGLIALALAEAALKSVEGKREVQIREILES